MPVDIFPEMNLPVCSVVWTYAGMDAQDIQNRILTLHERQMASLVDDISRIEATSYQGVGVEKVYLHEGADVTRAIAQLASSALVVLKYMPPNITPPLVIRYGATDVPIIQLALSSSSLPDTKLNDLGQNIIRPALAVVHGAQVPYPYGGKPRVIMADLDQQALQARGYSFVTLDALRTPGSWGDEVNPFSNGFNVLHQRQASNAIIASWPASKADPAVHFLRIPGTVPGAYRFDYAPNGVATGLSVADRDTPAEAGKLWIGWTDFVTPSQVHRYENGETVLETAAPGAVDE